MCLNDGNYKEAKADDIGKRGFLFFFPSIFIDVDFLHYAILAFLG